MKGLGGVNERGLRRAQAHVGAGGGARSLSVERVLYTDGKKYAFLQFLSMTIYERMILYTSWPSSQARPEACRLPFSDS